jgi:hypothetical protein
VRQIAGVPLPLGQMGTTDKKEKQIMNNWSDKTISGMAKRSDVVVLGVTILLAMMGALLVVFLGGQGIWGTWIPLCFITIPPIHYLCREVVSLRRKMEELEKRIG